MHKKTMDILLKYKFGIKLYHIQIKCLHSVYSLYNFGLDSELVTFVDFKYLRIMNAHFYLAINKNMASILAVCFQRPVIK